MSWQSTQSAICTPAAESMAWRMLRAIARDLGRHLKTILVCSAALRNIDWHRAWPGYLGALTITGFCSAIAFPLSPHVGLVTIVMFYLLGTTVGALRLGRGPSAFTAVTNTLAFNYFFVPPVFSFRVGDPQYVFALGVMLIVALVICNLVISIHRHRDTADAREERTAVLYAMSRELAAASDAVAMADAAVKHIRAIFHSSVTVLITDDNDCLSPVTPSGESAGEEARLSLRAVDLELAQEVVTRGERLISDAIYLPLPGSDRVRGVMIVRPQRPVPPLAAEQLQLFDAFAVQLALSLQRARLAKTTEAARIAADRVMQRNTLLASISHDLRTPLTALAGAGSLIAQPEYALNVDRRTTLGLLIERKARDMSRLLTNVLELMQLESSRSALRADWHSVEDLVALALRSYEARLSEQRIDVHLASNLPLVLVEATLIVQMLSNLLENASKYTPSGTTITISAAVQDKALLLVVADNGPGLPPGDSERVFESFHRGVSQTNIAGVGLGLAICRAGARLHGGEIGAMNNPGGGARFEITLPVAMQAIGPPVAESLSS
jgi:two-component system, OmpR family, sensor histidine kinase KdpD